MYEMFARKIVFEKIKFCQNSNIKNVASRSSGTEVSTATLWQVG
jgi:hypothetical protein